MVIIWERLIPLSLSKKRPTKYVFLTGLFKGWYEWLLGGNAT